MSELARTHYDVLGVSPTASAAEIELAARGLRGQPRVDAARAVLLDPAARATYERDLAVIAATYHDVADPLPIDAHGKLEALGAWLPAQAAPAFDDLARDEPELDGRSEDAP